MIDMKMSKKERKDSEPQVVGNSQGPEYPYGLELHLEEEGLKKLGLGFNDFKRGEKVTIKAVAEVQSRSESEGSDGKVHASVSLQIQKLELGKKGNQYAEAKRKKQAMGGVVV